MFKDGQIKDDEIQDDQIKDGQILALDGIEAEDVPDIQLDDIHCSRWERSANRLLIVPDVGRLERTRHTPRF